MNQIRVAKLQRTATEHADTVKTATEHSCRLMGVGASVQTLRTESEPWRPPQKKDAIQHVLRAFGEETFFRKHVLSHRGYVLY